MTFTVIPVLILVMAIWQIHARKAFIRVRQAIAVVNANLQENVSGVRVIQSLSREDENSQRFDRVNRTTCSANIEAGRVTAAVMPVGRAARRGRHGARDPRRRHPRPQRQRRSRCGVAAIVAFALYVQRFFDPIRDLVLQYTQLQRAMAGGERIFEVLDTKPEIVDAETPSS